MHRLVGRERLRQHVPLRARLGNSEHGVQHVARRYRLPPGRGRRTRFLGDKIAHAVPLRIGDAPHTTRGSIPCTLTHSRRDRLRSGAGRLSAEYRSNSGRGHRPLEHRRAGVVRPADTFVRLEGRRNGGRGWGGAMPVRGSPSRRNGTRLSGKRHGAPAAGARAPRNSPVPAHGEASRLRRRPAGGG